MTNVLADILGLVDLRIYLDFGIRYLDFILTVTVDVTETGLETVSVVVKTSLKGNV